MKTKLLGFVVLVLILSAASAFCAEWKLVGYGMTPNREKEFDSYIGSSERTAEGTIKAHIKQVYTPTGIRNLRGQLPNCSYTVFTMEMSCSTKEFRITKMMDFDKDDKMLEAYTQKDLAEADWGKIGAGTLAEIYFEDLCGKKLKPQTK